MKTRSCVDGAASRANRIRSATSLRSLKVHCAALVVVLAGGTSLAQAQLVAENDSYGVPFGETLLGVPPLEVSPLGVAPCAVHLASSRPTVEPQIVKI